MVIPEAAVEAAARGVWSYYEKSAASNSTVPTDEDEAVARSALEAALPTLLSHEREETRLAHLDAVVNAATVDRLERELAEATQLIRDLTDHDDCQFDHHGGCQAHGYLELRDICPQQDAKDWVRAHE